MLEKAKPARDKFTFSLGGMAAINSYAIAPLVADDQINVAWDRRFSRSEAANEPRAPKGASRFEDLLVRLFAPREIPGSVNQ